MQKPPCQTLLPWLRNNLGKTCLAPLTGTDARALAAAVQIIELYSYDRNQSVLHAFAQVVLRMQPKCWHLAYHAIAHVMDWSDRFRLWTLAGLPLLESISICEGEPTLIRRWLKPDGTYVFEWDCRRCGNRNHDDFGSVLPQPFPLSSLPCEKCGAVVAPLPPIAFAD